MKHRLVVALCALTLPFVASAACAQEAPPPSPKLDVFHVMVGKWRGKGTYTQAADAAPAPWTGTVDFQPILGGYFFQDDTDVDLGMGTPLHMRTVYGWDGERQKYVAFGLGNTGESNVGEVFFPQPGTMVLGVASSQNGQAVTARTIWKYGDGKMTFVSERATDDGKWFTEVEGAFEKVAEIPTRGADVSFVGTPVQGDLPKLTKRCAGTYDIKGTMTMMPGMPEMAIQGHETIVPAFGGHALMSTLEGTSEGGPVYHAHSYFTWNVRRNSFDMVMFSNMGEFALMEARFTDDDTLAAFATFQAMGSLCAQRTITKFGKDGIAAAENHCLFGAAEPMKNFQATYTKRKG